MHNTCGKVTAKKAKTSKPSSGAGGNKSTSTNNNSVNNLKVLNNKDCNPLENIEYTNKVKKQMKLGDYHSFPESVDAFGADGNTTTIIGGDGVVRLKVEIKGGYKKKEGVFEYIIEPDGKTVNHRLFRPKL